MVPNLAARVSKAKSKPRSKLWKNLHAARVNGISTLSTSVQWAQTRTDALIRECQRRIYNRELSALCILIEDNPCLALDRRIRLAVLELSQAARYRRSPGRPTSCCDVPRLIIVGLVEQFVREKQAANPEQAFLKLVHAGLGDLEAIKRKYYRALSEPRFRGLLIELDHSPSPSRKEAESALREAERLKPGGQIEGKVYFPEIEDEARVIIQATDDGPKVKPISQLPDKQSDNILVVNRIGIDGLNAPKT